MEHAWDRLADVLVGYPTATRPGERVLITMMELDTFPLVRAVHRRAVRAGAHVHVQFASALLDRDLLLHGDDEQAGWVPEPELEGMRWADVYVGLRSMRNPYELEDVPAERLRARRRALGVVSAERSSATRWVLVRVPNEVFAQKAGMSFDDMLEFFFEATLRDWRRGGALPRAARPVRGRRARAHPGSRHGRLVLHPRADVRDRRRPPQHARRGDLYGARGGLGGG